MSNPLGPFIADLAMYLRKVEDAIRYYQTMDNMLKLSREQRRVLVGLLWEQRDTTHAQLVDALKPSMDEYFHEQKIKADGVRQAETARLMRAEDMHRESIRRDVIKELVGSGWTGPPQKKLRGKDRATWLERLPEKRGTKAKRKAK